MNKLSLAGLVALTALVTGCPHNEYTVELTPRGKVIQRHLDFYRADGVDSNGAPKYESFPSNELAAITALYPAGAVTRRGEQHSATGTFSGALPGDVGGAGEYQHFSTSLGDASFYVERFRGNDDLAAGVRARQAAADQLTDLVIGWSRAEFGREPGYKNLRRFLDEEFRRDLDNLGQYFWAAEIAGAGNTNAAGEFTVRFGQYLVERGYLKIEDAPVLIQIHAGHGEGEVMFLVQKIVAEKLGVPPTGPHSESLALLTDSVALEKSWAKFLAGTKAYRVRLRQWEKDKRTKPDLEKPRPSADCEKWIATLVESGASGQDDHLTVRLLLTAAPDHTNGRWDEVRHQVVWEAPLETKGSARRLPVFCHANWSQADQEFQRKHFGRVILTGDKLLRYCVWQSGLKPSQAGDWEQLLADAQPGGEWTNRLAAFQFSSELRTNSVEVDFGRDLIKSALENQL